MAENLQSTPVVGLIGGIGSGKSSVAAAFAGHGCYTISGDRLGHEALRRPDVRARVVAHFGDTVLDATGQIDRRRLGALVFDDPEQRRVLEKQVFPYIERHLEEEIAAMRANPEARAIVVDAAIMLEAGWNRLCDRVVYVHAPRELRLQRLAEQRDWSAKEVQARENAQMSLTEKVTRADYVVDNSGRPAEVERQVENLLQLLTAGELR